MTAIVCRPAGDPGSFRRRVLALLMPVLLVAPAAAAAQEEEGEERAPAYVAAVEGTARVERDGQLETLERGIPLGEGDTIRTEAGRVELAFPNGTQIYLDRFAELELLEPLVVRLARGRIFARLTATRGGAERIEVDAPGATVRFLDDGEYRVVVGGTDSVEVELSTLRGSAELASEGGTVQVAAGQRAGVRDGERPTPAEWFNASASTPLERWAEEREAQWESGQYATSRPYLPEELTTYASTFDQHGSWQVDATYGSVWYPSAAADWRPYYNGRWYQSPRFGWTWIAHDPWGWPTHHYGRWHIGARGWFWIPSRRWGPAWVYWAVSPGYVGWCPLGWNGRPVINVFTYGQHRYPRARDPYRAWTVLPRDRFGRGHVPTHRADRTILDRERPSFTVQHVPPGYAPPRSPYQRASSVVRSPGMSSAAPSGGTPRSGRSGPASGYAQPRGGRGEQATDAYDRARVRAPRREAGRAPAGTPSGVTRPNRSDAANDADGGTGSRRAPGAQAPTRVPYGYGRTPRASDSATGSDDGSRPGSAAPRSRAPDSPGRSGRSDDSTSGPRSGRSGPPSRSGGADRSSGGDRSGGSARPRGGDNDGGRGRGMSSPPPSRSGGEGRSSGGAVRRHP
jgi:hypothetical protein